MMKIRIPKKHVAVGLAALLLVCSCEPYSLIAETVSESDTQSMTAAGAVPETEPEESEAESEPLSSVTIVHTADVTDNDYTVTDWWKADLDEYQDSFSLVKYETVENPEEDAAEDATLIAQGADGGTVISTTPTASAVSSVSAGTFAFTTYGYGHGVGMSQNGANFYANYAGWNYQDILFHYYPGTTLMNTGTAEKETVTVQGVSGNVLQQVAEIVYREVGGSMNVEAIRAQAVAVYTYIKYHHNDSHDLKGKANPPQNVVDACASVLGEALYYNGSYALTMFYASSGGITANCSDVFTMDIPYLRSVESAYDASHDPYYGEVVYFTVEQLRRKLQSAYGITLSDNPENWITLVEGNGGYVNKVIIDGKVTVRGNSFRSMMGFRSPKFTYICSIAKEEEPTEAVTEAPVPEAQKPVADTPAVNESTEPVETPTEASTTAPTEEPTEADASALDAAPAEEIHIEEE